MNLKLLLDESLCVAGCAVILKQSRAVYSSESVVQSLNADRSHIFNFLTQCELILSLVDSNEVLFPASLTYYLSEDTPHYTPCDKHKIHQMIINIMARYSPKLIDHFSEGLPYLPYSVRKSVDLDR